MDKRYSVGEFFMWVMVPIIFGIAMIIFLAAHEGKFSPSTNGVPTAKTASIQTVSTLETI